MTIFKGKRGWDSFSILLTVFAMMALTLILVSVTINYSNLSRTFGGAGSNAVSLLRVYGTADGALLYLDSAAMMSAEKAAYETGMSGFYGGGADNSNGYVYWSSGYAAADGLECKASFSRSLPTGYSIFNGYFRLALNEHIIAYNLNNDAKLVTSNHDLKLSQVAGGLEVLGAAASPIVVSEGNAEYRVKPSFREWINLDLIGDFSRITEKAAALTATEDTKLVAGNIQDAINSYNKEKDSNLVWGVAFDSSCSNQCWLGSSCFKCRIEYHDETVKVCSKGEDSKDAKDPEKPEDPKDPEDCTEETISVPDTICDIPGEKSHMFCSENAKVSVKVIDERYKSSSNTNGYKGFVSASGFTPYEYRFGLNWVEVQGIECCIGNSCTSDYSDVLISG